MNPSQNEKLNAACAVFMAEIKNILTAEQAQLSEFVNSKQTQQLLGGMCRQSIANYERSGKLRAYRIGNGRLKFYKRADCLALLQSNQEGGR
jgi:hypothetical protein